ncbi:hypothetical protein KAT95_01070 [Candidatus Parcubacteria bacterium]|nr:hypothetical protein [Candidatus Parcubacteria bacterium]
MKVQLEEITEPKKVRRARKKIRSFLHMIERNFDHLGLELIDKKGHKQGLRFRKVKSGSWMVEKPSDASKAPIVNTNTIEITELVDIEKELKKAKDVLEFQRFLNGAKIQ